ncbi:MAG: NAD-dependent epimerase/dehydratase family protein [Candidatus Muiribacteriota bacterium]
MKYLITGSTGFIGPYLAKHIAENGDFCRCLARDVSKAKTLIPYSSVDIVQGDVKDKKSIEGIADDIDVVFHLATLGHLYNAEVPEEMFHEINVKGTENIANEALKSKVKKFVHCSSVAAMGICDEVPATEKSICNPHHPYGISKLQAEETVLKLTDQYDLPASIVRFSMVYGPGDWRDMLKLVKLIKKGIFPKIGNRPKLTPLIHVQDAVTALLNVADKGINKEIYLITNEKPENFDDIRNYILKGLNIKRPGFYIPEWMALLAADIIDKTFTFAGKVPPVNKKNIESTIADRVFSVEKAVNDFGFKTDIPAEEGIVETVKWYKKKGWV